MYLRGLVLVTLLLASRPALAGWSYKWWCTGQCAPGSLAQSGTSRTFDTQAECDSARDADWHRSQATQSGNLANVDDCRETDGADASSDDSTPPEKVDPAGLMRFYGGPGIGAISDSKRLDGGGGGGGFQVARGWVPGDHGYMFGDIGFSTSTITRTAGMTSRLNQFDIVYGFEYMLGTGRLSAFIQLGAGLVLAGMDHDNDWVGLKGGAGVELSLSKTVGLVMFGSGIATPSLPASMFATFAIELRSRVLLRARRAH